MHADVCRSHVDLKLRDRFFIRMLSGNNEISAAGENTPKEI
jgi:hypothetical protein